MNTTEIGTYIRNPQQLNAGEVDDLKRLCEDYPYSGLLHILYLKALGNAKALDFEQSLKQCAIKIPNRELLFHLINEDIVSTNDVLLDEAERLTESHNNDSAEPNDESKTKISVDEEIEISDEEIEISKDEVLVSEEVVDVPISEQLAELTTHEIESQETDLPIDDKNAPEEQQQHQQQQTRYSLEDVSWLDNTITFEGFSNTNLDEIEEEEQMTFHAEQLGENEHVLDSKIEENNDVDESSAIETTEKRTKHTFYDWLNAAVMTRTSDIHSESEENVSHSEMVTQIEATSIELEHNSDISDVAPLERKAILKEKTNELVDKFIETEPKISRPKAVFFSPVKSAKESVREEGIPLSETLAKIYELQGNFPKAIAVLEKLCELIPQKASDFERRIAEVKAKMEN